MAGGIRSILSPGLFIDCRRNWLHPFLSEIKPGQVIYIVEARDFLDLKLVQETRNHDF